MAASSEALAAFIARNPDSNVLSLVSNAWAGFGAAFGPIVLLSLYWRKLTNWGALAPAALPRLREAMDARRVRLSIGESPRLRLVLHLDIDDTGLQRVVDGFASLA